MAVAAATLDHSSSAQSSISVTPPAMPGFVSPPYSLTEANHSAPLTLNTRVDSESSNKAISAQKRKTKRRQLVSCDTCRLRRVKCEKDEGSDKCRQCISKGVTCTDDYVRNKPRTLKRTGKLIEKAKAMYGDGNDEVQTSACDFISQPDPSCPDPPVLPSHEFEPRARQTLTWSPSGGAEQNLISTVLTSTLSNHLIDCYYTATHFQLPAVEWPEFREAYELAGRRSHELDPANEYLCHCIEAFGARVSDSPYILGSDGPRLADLKSQRGVNMSRWGAQRESFCEAMLERAIQTGDRNGSLRIAVEANMSGLILIDRMMQFRHHTRRGGRVFTAALIELMRTISDDHKAGVAVDEGTLASVEGGRIFWHVYLTDACRATVWRTASQMTEYDVERLCPGSRAATFQSIWEGLHVDDPTRLVAAAVQGLFGQLAGSAHGFVNWMIARALNARDGNVVADSDARVVRELFYSLEQSEALSSLFQRRVEQLIPTGSANFALWYNQLALIRALICLNAQCVVKEITAQAVENANSGLAPIGGTDVNEWATLKDEGSRRTFEGCREVASMLESMRSSGQIFGAAHPFFMQAYGHALLDVPITRLGGPPDWDLATKVKTVTLVLDAVKASAWCWGNAEADITHLERSIEGIKLEEGEATNLAEVASRRAASAAGMVNYDTSRLQQQQQHPSMNALPNAEREFDPSWGDAYATDDARGIYRHQAHTSQTTSPPPITSTLNQSQSGSIPHDSASQGPYAFRQRSSGSSESHPPSKAQVMSNGGEAAAIYANHQSCHHQPSYHHPQQQPIHTSSHQDSMHHHHPPLSSPDLIQPLSQSYHQGTNVPYSNHTNHDINNGSNHLGSHAHHISTTDPSIQPNPIAVVDEIGRYGFPSAIPGGLVGFGLGGGGWYPGTTGSMLANRNGEQQHQHPSLQRHESNSSEMLNELPRHNLETYEPAYDGFLNLPVPPLNNVISL